MPSNQCVQPSYITGKSHRPFSQMDGRWIWLRSGRTGRYCRDRVGNIQCDRDKVRDHERFYVKLLGGDKVALKGGNKNRWCSDRGGEVECNHDLKSWEIFTYKDLGNNRVALKGGRTGKWCSDDKNKNKIICNRDRIGSWESFDYREVGHDRHTTSASVPLSKFLDHHKFSTEWITQNMYKYNVGDEDLKYVWNKYPDNSTLQRIADRTHYFGDAEIGKERRQRDHNRFQASDFPDQAPAVKSQKILDGGCDSGSCWIYKAPDYTNLRWANVQGSDDFGDPERCSVTKHCGSGLMFTGYYSDRNETKPRRNALCGKLEYNCPKIAETSGAESNVWKHRVRVNYDVNDWRNMDIVDHVQCNYPIDAIKTGTQARDVMNKADSKQIPKSIEKGLMQNYCLRKENGLRKNIYKPECADFCLKYARENICGENTDWERGFCKGKRVLNLGDKKLDPSNVCTRWCQDPQFRNNCIAERNSYCAQEYNRLKKEYEDEKARLTVNQSALNRSTQDTTGCTIM